MPECRDFSGDTSVQPLYVLRGGLVPVQGRLDQGMGECLAFLWRCSDGSRAGQSKSAVTRSNRNEPVINDDFAAFAEHYGCAVYPARVRHPKDKALVENTVKFMYKSVYADIEGLMFHDIETLNIAIQSSLEKFNSKQMSNRKESRRELFEETEKDYLRPLPPTRC